MKDEGLSCANKYEDMKRLARTHRARGQKYYRTFRVGYNFQYKWHMFYTMVELLLPPAGSLFLQEMLEKENKIFISFENCV